MLPGQEFAPEGLAELADAGAVARAGAVAAVVAAVAEAAAVEVVGFVESWWNEQGRQAGLRVEPSWVDLRPRCASQTCPVHIHAASA